MDFALGIILFHMHYGYIFSVFFLTVVFASMTKMRFRHQQKKTGEEEEAISYRNSRQSLFHKKKRAYPLRYYCVLNDASPIIILFSHCEPTSRGGAHVGQETVMPSFMSYTTAKAREQYWHHTMHEQQLVSPTSSSPTQVYHRCLGMDDQY